jgi:hypothetical protein
LPDEVYADPEVVAATHAAIRRHGNPPPMAQPTRAQLLAALGTAPEDAPADAAVGFGPTP